MATPLTTEQQNEVVRWMPTARSMASVYVKRAPRLKDDIFSVANLATCKAVQQYKPGNAQFSSYLWHWVRSEIGVLFNREFLSRWKCRIEWEANNALAWHADSRLTQRLNDVDEIDAFEARIASLTAIEQQILRARFVQGIEQKDLVKTLGLCRTNIAAKSAEAQRKLAVILGAK